MKNYYKYILGIILLLGGIAIGWMVKPGPSEVHDHANEGIGSPTDEKIWTCSMHPQIRQPESGICPICEMDLIPLDNSSTNSDPTILQMSQEAVKLAQIETVVVGGKDKNIQNQEWISVDGTIEIDERSIQTQTVHLTGRIESMKVSFEGQYVQKGQEIASIYSTELLAASEELITATQFNNRIEGLQDAVIQKLKNWKLTDIQIQDIIARKEPLTTIKIYAEKAGYVLEKFVSQGDYIRQGQGLYAIGSTSNLWLVFQVFESDLAKVKKGQNITFTTPSIPGKVFDSRITYINPLLEKSTRTATVRAEINNRGNLLKPGMLIEGNLLNNDRSANAENLTIPNSAVLWTGERSVVYVKVPDQEIPSYQFKEVLVLDRGNKYSTIAEGIEKGDEIVVHGAFAIDAAAQLNNNFSMMNRSVTIKEEKDGEIIPDFSGEVSITFMDYIDQVVIEYLALKDALVETNPVETSKNAQDLLVALEKVDMSLLSGLVHDFWMEKQRAIQIHAERISQAKDVEIQRDEFEFLSEALINTIKGFGTNNKEYYVQYCPMAKNDQGANWIAVEETIRNPYFGDKMLKCGVVKLVLN